VERRPEAAPHEADPPSQDDLLRGTGGVIAEAQTVDSSSGGTFKSSNYGGSLEHREWEVPGFTVFEEGIPDRRSFP